MREVANALLLGFVSVSLIDAGRKTFGADRSHYRSVLRRMRWWMVGVSVAYLMGASIVVVALMQVPGLGWGWYRLLNGHNGNVILGQTGSPGIGFTVASYLIPVALVCFVPLLALWEEETFRAGIEDQSVTKRWSRATQFGLAHLIVGIPIAAALVLIISGLLLNRVYLHAYRRAPAWQDAVAVLPPEADLATVRMAHPEWSALTASAAMHAVMNWTIFAFAGIAIVLLTILG